MVTCCHKLSGIMFLAHHCLAKVAKTCQKKSNVNFHINYNTDLDNLGSDDLRTIISIILFKIVWRHFRAGYVQFHSKCSVSVIIKIAFFLMPLFQPSASLGLVWLHKYWEACSPRSHFIAKAHAL